MTPLNGPRFSSRSFGTSAVAALSAIGLSCAAPSSQQSAARPGAPSDAAVHAVHSDRLQILMRDLSRLSLARAPQELDSGAERRRRARAVAETAADMAVAADDIPAALNDVQMADEHRARFTALAAQLRNQAADLEALAREEQVLEMEAKLFEINQTCTSCHSAFRVLPVVPPGPQP
jgi:cytochrome c556